VVNYCRKEGEAQYTLIDEPFDYNAWKTTKKISLNSEPSIRVIGTDSNNHIVMDMSVPTKGDVYVEIKDSQGEVVWHTHAGNLKSGVHQLVWDGVASPGLYSAYVKGTGWDVEKQIVIYT
jgi:hypothetical protein